MIRMQTKGGEWATSAGSNASAGLEIKSTADLNNYRGLLGQATRQAGLAQSRLENLFGVVKQVGKPGGGFGIGNGQPGGGEGSGNGNGFGGMGEAAQGSGNRRPMNAYAGPRLNQEW